jgi:hypothetical protein
VGGTVLNIVTNHADAHGPAAAVTCFVTGVPGPVISASFFSCARQKLLSLMWQDKGTGSENVGHNLDWRFLLPAWLWRMAMIIISVNLVTMAAGIL